MKKILLLLLVVMIFEIISAQEINLTLDKVIELARQNSFEAFSAEKSYIIKNLDYIDFNKELFPRIDLSLTPGNYDRSINELWDSEEGRYKAYEVQWLSSFGKVSLNKEVGLTGGQLNVYSSLNRSVAYYKGNNNMSNYISNPIFLSYSQDLYAINQYKWRSKEALLEIKLAERQLIEDFELANIKAVSLFFNMLSAQMNYSVSLMNKNNADTLYVYGHQKFEIGSLSNADLLLLELNKVKADIELESSILKSESASLELNDFLELPRNTQINCTNYSEIPIINISAPFAISKALENNPNIVNLERKIIEAQKALKVAKNNELNIQFTVGVGLNQNQNAFKDSYSNLLDRQSAALSLTMPILDWGSNRRHIQKALLNKQLVEESNRKQLDQFEVQVLNMVNSFSIKSKQMKASVLADSISRVVYHAVQQQYLMGNSNIMQLNSSYTEMKVAQTNYINTLRDFWIQFYSIRSLCLYDFIKNEELSVNVNSLEMKFY